MNAERTDGRTGTWGIALATLLAFAVGAGLLLTRGADAPETPEIADFSEATEAVAVVAGGPPERCVFAGPDRQLCRWRVSGRLLSGDHPTPPGGKGGVYLLCELQRGGGTEPSCEAHALDAAALPPVSAVRGIDGQRARIERAEQALALALTVTDLSQLVGDLPERCNTGFETQTCAWRLEPGSRAHDSLAALGATSDAAILRCRVPLDGRPRVADSCKVQPEAAAS